MVSTFKMDFIVVVFGRKTYAIEQNRCRLSFEGCNIATLILLGILLKKSNFKSLFGRASFVTNESILHAKSLFDLQSLQRE